MVEFSERLGRGVLWLRSRGLRMGRKADLPIHFLLRYSDNLRQVDTIGEHRRVISERGYVWLGKFGVGAAADKLERARRQIEAQQPTFVFLASQSRIRYRATLLDVAGGGATRTTGAPEPDHVPKYYSNARCSVWFKLKTIETVEEREKQGLVLFNSPAFPPEEGGMRGLVYLTMRSANSEEIGRKYERRRPRKADLSFEDVDDLICSDWDEF